MAFDGWPTSMLEFYAQLEVNNTKEFWEEHREVYDEDVRAPMEALVAELSETYGEAKIFRPYRDVRFSKDKSPYKTEVAAVFHGVAGGSGGRYVRANADGLACGGGYYRMSRDQLARFREVIARDGREADQLQGILDDLAEREGEVGGETLATSPRGIDRDHPRIELLRHKSLTYLREVPPGPVVQSREALDVISQTFDEVGPMLAWLDTHVGAPEEPRRR